MPTLYGWAPMVNADVRRLVGWHAPRLDIVPVLVRQSAVCLWREGDTEWRGQVSPPALVRDCGPVGVWRVEAPQEWCDVVSTAPQEATGAPCPYVASNLPVLIERAAEIRDARLITTVLDGEGTLQQQIERALEQQATIVRGADYTAAVWYRAVLRNEATAELPRAGMTNAGETNYGGVEAFGRLSTTIHDLWEVASADIVASIDPEGVGGDE